MRLSLSGLLADAVMQQFETKTLKVNYPSLGIRHVHDMIVVSEEAQMDQSHQHLSTIAPSKKEGKNSTLIFLDIFIIKQPNGSAETTVYRKITTGESVLNFKSNQLTCHLKSCVRTLYDRADKNCGTRHL